MMIPTDNEEAIEVPTFDLKLAKDIDGNSIKIFEEKIVAAKDSRHSPKAWIRAVAAAFFGLLFSILTAFGVHTNHTVVMFTFAAAIVCYVFSLCVLMLSDENTQTILVPTGRGQDLLIDVHGGLACDICGTPERSLYPPEQSLVAQLQSAKLVEARYKAAKMRGHQARCNCVRCYNVNKWFTRQEFIAFYNREPAEDNIGYSYRK